MSALGSGPLVSCKSVIETSRAAMPTPGNHPPAGPNRLHEIKHDGFRRRDPCFGRRSAAKLLTRDEARRIAANIAAPCRPK